MVTSQNRDTIWEAYFQANEQGDCLDRVVATIDVVSHEQVIVVGQLSSNVEKLLQIPELSVNVTADR